MNNTATMQYRVLNENGKVQVELYNGYGAIRIPADTLHKLDSAVLKLERELGKEKIWRGEKTL